MKKLFFLLIPAMMLFACNNADKKTDEKCIEDEKCEQVACTKDMMTVDSLLANLETNLGKEVKVCGKCTHVCHHSGKNIFLTNPEDEDIMIFGTTAEGLEKFDAELEGKNIYLKGILKSAEVEENEAEVHHDIVIEYYIEVTEAKECCGGHDKKGSKCCGDKKEGDHKCGEHK